MSLAYYRAVWAHSKATDSARLVLLALAEHANEQGVCWPSVPRLARMVKKSVRQVQRSLNTLAELSELYLERGAGYQGVNRYHLLIKPVHDAKICLDGDTDATPYTGFNSAGLGGVTQERPHDMSVAGGVTQVSPKALPEPTKNHKQKLPPLTPPQPETYVAAHIPDRGEEDENDKQISQQTPLRAVRKALGDELWKQLRLLTKKHGSSTRWDFWVAETLAGDLSRLGPGIFRAAVHDALEQAKNPDIKYPARFLETRLKIARPAAGIWGAKPEGADSALVQILSVEATPEPVVKGPAPLVSLGWSKGKDRQLGVPPPCPYCGSDPAGDDCCEARSLDQLSWILPYLERPQRGTDPEEVAGLQDSARRAVQRIRGGEPTALERALARVGERRGEAGLMDARVVVKQLAQASLLGFEMERSASDVADNHTLV